MNQPKRIPISTMANGTEMAIYLHELEGRLGDGPTVGFCAAIHGNEPTGTQILLELARELVEGRFRGRLLLLPVANPLAFEANFRNTPTDHLNLNRLFPGTESGWFSEQLAKSITDEFLIKVDVLVDIHSGGDRPTVDYVYIRNAEELSRAFGSPVLYRADPDKVGTMFQGTSLGVTEERGVPSLTIELGGGLIDQNPYIARGVRGLKNILSTLEMLDEPAATPPPQKTLASIVTVRPRMGGFLESEATELGSTISKGACLGRIIHPQTFAELERIDNPLPDGVLILSHLTRNLVQPGDYGYMIGELEN